MPRLARHSLHFLLTTLVLAAVLLPRIAVIGHTPHTDEGFYLYNAMFMYQSLMAGNGLPPQGMLLLYPALLSLLAGVDANLFFVFRVADMLVTAACAFVLWRLLRQESGSLIAGALLTAAFIYLMNLQPFIMAGFRNSLFAAYIPLLLALILALRTKPLERREWMICGAYVALGVLLRENLAIFAFFGGFCVLIAHGWRPAFQYALGGTITAIAVLSVLVLLRGNAVDIFHAYTDMAALNDINYAKNWERFQQHILHCAALCKSGIWLVFAIALLGGINVTFKRRWNRSHFRRSLLWLAIALLPLVEPVAKTGTYYHYSTCLIGLSGLAAFWWRQLSDSPKFLPIILGVSLSLFFLDGNLKGITRLESQWRTSKNNLKNWQSREWLPQAVESNHFLYLAARANEHLPEDAYLSTGYQVYVAYPATDNLPPSYTMSNLTIAAMVMDEAALAAEIRKCLPAVILVVDKSLPANKKLFALLDSMPEYHAPEFFPAAARRVGAYTGHLYTLNLAKATYCKVPS